MKEQACQCETFKVHIRYAFFTINIYQTDLNFVQTCAIGSGRKIFSVNVFRSK